MSPLRLAAVALALAALAATRAPAQEKENPIVAKVRVAVKDPSRPFTLTILLAVKEGAGEKFEAAFAKAAAQTRKEKGCLAYNLDRNAAKPGRYLIYERWRDLGALERHLKAAHTTALLAELRELADGQPDVHVLVPAAE